MYRIDDATGATSLPTPEAALAEAFWTEGSPTSGVPATLIRASWLNMIQEELRAVVVAAGLTPSKTTYNQLLTAIKTLTSPGRLLRTSIYTQIAGVQMVSVNGGANTTTGATTWTALAATMSIDYEVQGAGAPGAGCGSATASQISIAGGGSAGTYARGYLTSGFSGSLAVTVGVGGIGAVNSTGSAPGSSSVGSILTCPGGVLSAVGSTVTPGTTPFIAGGTGQSSAPTGTYLYAVRGGQGYYGAFYSSNGFVSGQGGSSQFGSGAPPVSSFNPGTPSVNYGAGGSGSLVTGGNSANAGGNGKDGIVIIREYA